jgi:hypothetical protein
MPLKKKESTIAKTERADKTHRVSKQQLLIIEEIYSSIPLAPIAVVKTLGWDGCKCRDFAWTTRVCESIFCL